MPFSRVVNGKVLDYSYKKLGDTGLQAFYVGDIYVGQVSEIGGAWTAISREPFPFMPVHGFKARGDAAEFLISLIDLNK